MNPYSRWTLTPDGLKTDEQLADEQWNQDYFQKSRICSDKLCSNKITKAQAGLGCVVVTRTVLGGLVYCPRDAAVACTACGNAWCKEHAG